MRPGRECFSGSVLGALLLGLLACPGPREGGELEGSTSEGAQAVEEKGGLAPDFTLSSLDGRQVSLRSFLGQTVLIDFWATWCAPCVYQIPVLNRFQDTHRDDGVVVLGVSVDVAGRDVVAAFAREHDIRYPVLLGSEAMARRYGAPGFPSLVVIGPQGRIESVHVGVLEAETLETLVDEVGSSRLVAPGENPV